MSDECPMCNNSWAVVKKLAKERDYAQAKSADVLAKLDDARREIERLTAERDAARENTARLTEELHASKATSAAIFQANIDATEADNEASRASAANRVRALAARLTAQTEREQRNVLANELVELRRLAERAMRGTETERLLAASLVCARLVRPPDAQKAAAEALATCHAAANGDSE